MCGDAAAAAGIMAPFVGAAVAVTVGTGTECVVVLEDAAMSFPLDGDVDPFPLVNVSADDAITVSGPTFFMLLLACAMPLCPFCIVFVLARSDRCNVV